MNNFEQLLDLSVGETPEDKIIKKQLFYDVHKALEKRILKHRDIAHMFYWDEISCIKIAEIVGTSPNCVRVTLYYIRDKLKAYLIENDINEFRLT